MVVNKKWSTYSAFLLMSATVLLSSCYSSVATKLVKAEGLGNQIQGKNIMQIVWRSQGLDLMEEHSVYHVVMNDDWRGLTGKIGTMWPNPNIDLDLKFAVGTFDGQAKFLSGKRKGDVVGVQSWSYYEFKNDSAVFEKKLALLILITETLKVLKFLLNNMSLMVVPTLIWTSICTGLN